MTKGVPCGTPFRLSELKRGSLQNSVQKSVLEAQKENVARVFLDTHILKEYSKRNAGAEKKQQCSEHRSSAKREVSEDLRSCSRARQLQMQTSQMRVGRRHSSCRHSREFFQLCRETRRTCRLEKELVSFRAQSLREKSSGTIQILSFFVNESAGGGDRSYSDTMAI